MSSPTITPWVVGNWKMNPMHADALQLIEEFKPYPISHDIGRHTSEIFLDEINNIMINYDPECSYDEKMKEIMNNFINHEMYFVLGETSPNGYDRKIHYRYRTDKNTNNKGCL